MSSLSRSPWLLHYDASSCNGCDIEVLACLTPVYDVERLGVINTGNPKHADIFLVTGSVNEQNKHVIENLYHQLPEPKVVVAVGICATSGGIYVDCYNVYGGVDKVIPVDVYVPGCAARPESIIDGVITALGVLENKRRQLASMDGAIDQMVVSDAGAEDLPEILALQKIAYRSEAEIYQNFGLAPLRQTEVEIERDYTTKLFLKLVVNGKIVGTVRADREGESREISRLAVHPYFRRRGLGKQLLQAIEGRLATSGAKRLFAFTWFQSARNINLFTGAGYRIYKTEDVSEDMTYVYVEKLVDG
jgi:ech hydrogenase subunit C